MALLRHYSFAPETAKLDAIAAVLIKAMMRLPEPDFAQLLHLIPERVQVWVCAMHSVGLILIVVYTLWHVRTAASALPQLLLLTLGCTHCLCI